MKNKLGGLKPRTRDDRDFSLGAIIDWKKAQKEMREAYLCRPLSIKDQNADGNLDYCAACAGAGMIEPKEETILYYPYLFAAAKYESGDVPDSWGLQMRDVGKALQKWGCPEVKDVPDEIKNMPESKRRRFENYPDELREKAKKHRAKTYFFIEGPYEPFQLARIAQWYFRHNLQNIMFGVKWSWPLSEYDLTSINDGYGHALWQQGYDPHGILAVNSAGSGAGRNGTHKIYKDIFNHFAEKYGMMMVVDMDREDAENYLDTGVKLTDNWLIDVIKRIIYFIKMLWRKN